MLTPGDILKWHRMFAMLVVDLLTGSSFQVEVEKELALKSQMLDVVIVRRADLIGSLTGLPSSALELPDGLEELRSHNLLTYKSQHEALSVWAIDELIGHYVNYCKLVSPRDRLLPETDFGLYAIATRFPRELERRVPFLATGMPGVFDIPFGPHQIRLIVLGEIACHPRNAAWELFSVKTEPVRHGAEHYRFRSNDSKELLTALYLTYRLELPEMAYTMEQFVRETHQDILQHMTLEERLHGLAPEDVLKCFGPEERLRGLAPEERLRGLAPEDVLRRFGPEERLRGLSSSDLHRLKGYLDKLN
jgi:hypothetical protein